MFYMHNSFTLIHIDAQETIETTKGIPLWITFNILRVEYFSCYTTLPEAFGIIGSRAESVSNRRL